MDPTSCTVLTRKTVVPDTSTTSCAGFLDHLCSIDSKDVPLDFPTRLSYINAAPNQCQRADWHMYAEEALEERDTVHELSSSFCEMSDSLAQAQQRDESSVQDVVDKPAATDQAVGKSPPPDPVLSEELYKKPQAPFPSFVRMIRRRLPKSSKARIRVRSTPVETPLPADIKIVIPDAAKHAALDNVLGQTNAVDARKQPVLKAMVEPALAVETSRKPATRIDPTIRVSRAIETMELMRPVEGAIDSSKEQWTVPQRGPIVDFDVSQHSTSASAVCAEHSPTSTTYCEMMQNSTCAPVTPLSMWLAARNLLRFEPPLARIGVKRLADLAYVTEDDLINMNMSADARSHFHVHVVA